MVGKQLSIKIQTPRVKLGNSTRQVGKLHTLSFPILPAVFLGCFSTKAPR